MDRLLESNLELTLIESPIGNLQTKGRDVLNVGPIFLNAPGPTSSISGKLIEVTYLSQVSH